MEEWKEYKLEEVGKITTGKTPKTAIKEFFEGNILFVTPADINTPYKYVYSTARYLSEEGLSSISSNCIEKGSICVSCIGNIGYVGIVDMKCASNQQINSITVNQEHDRDFVYYAIKNLWPYFKNYEGQSTTLSILNKGQFSKIVIKAPQKEIQQRIASILSSLDEKIEINRRINANLEQQAQALFNSWFVDFEPFKNQSFVESEFGMIPEGWKIGKLEELIDIKYGKDHKKLIDGPIPVYGSGGLMRYAEKALYAGESVLIPRKGTLDNIMYVNEEFWTVDTMFFSIPKKKDVALFVYLLLKNKDMSSMNVGSAVPSMTTKILNNITVVIPPNEVFSKFNSIVRSLSEKIQHNQKVNITLSGIRDTLLPRLMSGELEVKDIKSL